MISVNAEQAQQNIRNQLNAQAQTQLHLLTQAKLAEAAAKQANVANLAKILSQKIVAN